MDKITQGRRILVIGRFAVAAALAVGMLLWAPPAQAHTEVVASLPAAGEAVALSTDRLVVSFSDELVPGTTDVVVRDPDGVDVTVGEPGVSGQTLSVRLDLSEPGRHTVSYRAMGSDGHVVIDSFRFDVAPAGSRVAASAASVAGSPELGATGVDRSSGSSGTSSWWLLLVAGLGGVLALLHAAGRRRVGRRSDVENVELAGADR